MYWLEMLLLGTVTAG